MKRSCVMNRTPEVSLILPLIAKFTVSPFAALSSAARNVPGPLSALFVTVIVAERIESGTAQLKMNVISASEDSSHLRTHVLINIRALARCTVRQKDIGRFNGSTGLGE